MLQIIYKREKKWRASVFIKIRNYINVVEKKNADP